MNAKKENNKFHLNQPLRSGKIKWKINEKHERHWKGNYFYFCSKDNTKQINAL